MIAIGRITRSIGVKGEVKVEILTDVPNRFFELQTVLVGTTEADVVEHALLGVRKQGSGIVVKLDRVSSRSSSDTVAGKYIFLPDDQARRPSAHSFFHHELAGLNVITDEGRQVGTIKEIVRLPGGDTWIVESGSKEIMIPGVREFIQSVDLAKRMVVIHPIDGLLE